MYRLGSTPSRARPERGFSRRSRQPVTLTVMRLSMILMGLMCASPLLAAPAHVTTLEYQAYAAGAPVGAATVQVSLVDDAYHVTGFAQASSWLRGFSEWRNRFSARGRVRDDAPEPQEFSYREHDRRKSRQVVVRDGTLQVTKNDRRRPRRQAPGGADVISALFVRPHCSPGRTVHTGRHVYRLERLQQAEGCRYRVVDDDGDTFELELEFTRRAGLVVPSRMTVHGWLTGWIELTDTVRPGAPP